MVIFVQLAPEMSPAEVDMLHVISYFGDAAIFDTLSVMLMCVLLHTFREDTHTQTQTSSEHVQFKHTHSYARTPVCVCVCVCVVIKLPRLIRPCVVTAL